MSDYNFALPGLMEMQTPNSDKQPEWLVFDPHSLSDSRWIGVSSMGPFTMNGEPMEFAATRVVLEFYDRFWEERVMWTLDSEPGADGTVEIQDPDTWLFLVPEQELGLAEGMWNWRLKITDASGLTNCFYRGTMIVTP